MWLLDTHRSELHYFVSPEDVPGGYAILSHVWGDKEQSFQELKDLIEECASRGTNPRDRTSEKIKRSCELAERHGIKWIWNDTCCIDKSSSAELSEAINSMFHYYSLAQDVPPDDDLHHLDSAFRKSKWHSRGWTLQELLAPKIPTRVLSLNEDMTDVSVAERMSWAASRQTTRPEDEAYCLMGIFGINMAPLYGEGSTEAFWRLQEGIMKSSMDTSLFAWGAQFPSGGLSPPSTASDPSRALESEDTHSHDDDSACILASSVSFFKDCNVASSGSTPDMRKAYPTTLFFTTPYGIGAQTVPLVDASLHFGAGAKVAILGWHRDGQHLGLLLTECRSLYATDSFEPLYDIGAHGFRLVPLGPSQERPSLFGEPVITTRHNDLIYLLHRPSDRNATVSVRAPAKLASINLKLSSPFRIPQRHIDALLRSTFPLDLQSVTEPRGAWDGSDPVVLVFKWLKADPPIRDHWAKILHHSRRDCVGSVLGPDLRLGANVAAQPDHICDDDHIVRWDSQSSSFVKCILLEVATAPGVRMSLTLTLSFALRSTRLCNTFVGSLTVTM
ncbi:hypothetical protein V8D89_009079 [Ganoderma adspersum]